MSAVKLLKALFRLSIKKYAHYFRNSYFFIHPFLMKAIRSLHAVPPPTDMVSSTPVTVQSGDYLGFYLEAVSKLVYSINLCTKPCCACQRENKQMHFFCLWLLRMMDYSAQIAVIIGKPLTFRHYAYPYIHIVSVSYCLDLGCRSYGIEENICWVE